MNQYIRVTGTQVQLVENRWQLHTESGAWDREQAVLLPLSVWKTLRCDLVGQDYCAGVILNTDDDPLELLPDIAQLSLIEVHIPKMSDGRAFSIARLLRERCAYRGELRASGYFIAEQSCFLQRCGFDAFAPEKQELLESIRQCLNDFTFYYQGAANTLRPAFGEGPAANLSKQHE